MSEELSTLKGVLRIAQYHRGVMLLYSDGGCNELPDRISSRVNEVRKQEERMLLVWHPSPGGSPVDVGGKYRNF